MAIMELVRFESRPISLGDSNIDVGDRDAIMGLDLNYDAEVITWPNTDTVSLVDPQVSTHCRPEPVADRL